MTPLLPVSTERPTGPEYPSPDYAAATDLRGAAHPPGQERSRAEEMNTPRLRWHSRHSSPRLYTDGIRSRPGRCLDLVRTHLDVIFSFCRLHPFLSLFFIFFSDLRTGRLHIVDYNRKAEIKQRFFFLFCARICAANGNTRQLLSSCFRASAVPPNHLSCWLNFPRLRGHSPESNRLTAGVQRTTQ